MSISPDIAGDREVVMGTSSISPDIAGDREVVMGTSRISPDVVGDREVVMGTSSISPDIAGDREVVMGIRVRMFVLTRIRVFLLVYTEHVVAFQKPACGKST